jgi:hypothetical protein
MIFVVTLAVIFGVRASADALAVVIGVVLGVLASVPTTALLTYLLTRPRSAANGAPAQAAHQPPVVVMGYIECPMGTELHRVGISGPLGPERHREKTKKDSV